MLSLEEWKTVVEIMYYVVAILAVMGAAWTYRKNRLLEQSRWASTFYEKFYETDRYKEIRDKLDCPADLTEVNYLVDTESPLFTDYLNFFEHVIIFTRSEQLKSEDVENSFRYYLNCLKKLDKVWEYIDNEEKGYENLRKYLREREQIKWYKKTP
ncbi:MAG TPA: hypothetical protein VF703_07910 [Pyrinomonadaceae bacterium]|jgi:hypothetical protein